MSSTRRSPAITAATAATTGKTALPVTTPASTPRMRSRQPSTPREKTVYFNINVYDMHDNHPAHDNRADYGACDIGESDDPEIVEVLQAGKSYLLAITCEKRPSSINEHLKQDGQSVAGDFSLILSYAYTNTSVTTPITPAKMVFDFPAIFDEQFTHMFTLPADFPACTVTLLLKLKTARRPFPIFVAQHTLAVGGWQPAPELEIFRVSRINQRLPEKTALLLVEAVESSVKHRVHEQLIRLRGWHEGGLQLDEPVMVKAIVSVEELQAYRLAEKKARLGPEAILKRLTNFSRNSSPRLLNWLNRCFLNYHEHFNLIITDLTDREIPWELLQFDPGLYLGACARVVHWLPTQYFSKETRALSVKAERHEGPVISYVDQELGADEIEPEQEALRVLTTEPYASLVALRKRLHDSLEDVGLIYIGCHGLRGQGVGSLQGGVPELASIMLEGIYFCETPRLTVFLNACESARIIKKSPDDQSSFVEAFLAHCARGFIGTLARVEILTASRIAQQILLAAARPRGVQPAEQLRLLRKNEIERLRAAERDGTAESADYFRVIDTFMYVYYGNPLARLHLHQRKEPGV